MIENYKDIPIEFLISAHWNYKTESAEMQGKLNANIDRNGQLENLIVRQMHNLDPNQVFYEVVNGNHRLKGFQDRGAKTVTCYDLGVISESHAKRIAIETNETRFGTDPIKLSQIINEIAQEFSVSDMIETMPMSGSVIEAHIEASDLSWNELSDPGPSPGLPDMPDINEPPVKQTLLCPHCGQHFDYL